jgi:hypothetical protein
VKEGCGAQCLARSSPVGGGICRNISMSSRERSLLVTKYNPSALNKAIDAL